MYQNPIIILTFCCSLFFFAFSASLEEYCPQDYWNYGDPSFDQQLYLNDLSQFSSIQKVKLGIGLWFSYRPFDESLQKYYEEIDSGQSTINFFLYKQQKFSDFSNVIFSFLEFNIILKEINLVFIVQIQNGYQKQSIKINNLSIDGDWGLLYFYIDQEQKSLLCQYFSYNQFKNYSVVIKDFSLFDINDLIISTTRYKTDELIDGQLYETSQLPGIVLELITTPFNLLSNMQLFFESCLPQISCSDNQFQLIQYNQLFDGSNFLIKQLQENMMKNYFQISGWVKQNSLTQDLKLDSLLLRITTNQQFFDDNQIGDRLLYVIYHQSNVISQNGFTFQTYSYDYPIKLNQYKTESDNIIKVLSSDLAEILSNWHYFIYFFGSIENNGQPQIKIYYPNQEVTFSYNWNKEIHLFTNVKFYFHFAGDDYFQNQFKSYLSGWNIKIFCDKNFELVYDIPCHYTCLTCRGITEQDCLSCSGKSKRQFSPIQKQCVCPINYVNIDGQADCQLIEKISGIYNPIEIEIDCLKKGYYECNNGRVECEYGFFLYNNQCVKCPHFEEIQSEYWIQCPDCYNFPELFSSNLSCKFSFKANSITQPYYFTETAFSTFEKYYISQDESKNYYLQLVQGAYFYDNSSYCKPGFFYDKNKNCQICIRGCSTCDHSKSCSQCFIGYYMTQENQCEPCKMCHACDYKDGQQLCYYPDNCKEKQYWFNNKCYDCGQNCQVCSSDQCFYCIDNSKYFLKIDKKSCALCPIENCKHCFEHFKIYNTLMLSLDISIDSIYETVYKTIKIGCAQCYDGFYFSYVSQKCEQKPKALIDCQEGIYFDQSGKTICLKSQTLATSIQSTYCNNIAFCLECINNYSLKISSFCIICQDGYYANVVTGQCKVCPQGCRTCGQQNKNLQDFWKWDIKAFYQYFVNSDGTHSFEQNAVTSNSNDYEIICLNCYNNYMLYQNQCFKGCDRNCNDCRIYHEQTSSVYYPICYECKAQINNKQRSLQKILTYNNQIDSFQCFQCAEFCEACYQRTSNQIKDLNPFFDQSSKYLYHSNICVKYHDIDQQNYMLPKYFNPQFCRNYKKCRRVLEIGFIVFCSKNQYYNEIFGNAEQKLKDRFLYIYNMMITSPFIDIEQPEIFDYLNNNIVEEILFQFAFQQAISSNIYCFTDAVLPSVLSNNLKVFAFYLNLISLEIFAENTTLYYQLSNLFKIENFDIITIKNFEFYMPVKNFVYPSALINATIIFKNDFVPMQVQFINCNFTQSYNDKFVYFQATSNRPKRTKFTVVKLKQLQVQDSVMFDFQPLSEYNDSSFQVINLTMEGNVFKNTSIFYFSAITNSLDYQISMKSITIINSRFINSSFINSDFNLYFDIGFIMLQDIYLENVIFEQNSNFMQVLASLGSDLRNITLSNVIFLDYSSFIIANTFNINFLIFLNCTIQKGAFITNKKGDFSQSKNVVNSSRTLKINNIIFDKTKYIVEKSFIYIVDQSQIELTIKQLVMDNCQDLSNQIELGLVDPMSYEFSLIYIECTYCYFEEINITRGFGRPEISIIQSQKLEIKNLYITLRKEYYYNSLHSSINCVKKFNFMNNAFVIYISQFHILNFENILVEEMLIFDNNIIQIEGQSINDIQKDQDAIHLKNSIFQKNVLIITQLYRATSIFSIFNQQSTDLLIENTIFSNNLVYKYEDDTQLHSASTLLIEFQIGKVNLLNTTFYQNVIYNSTDSILYIKTSILILQDCKFIGSNIFNAEAIQKNILLEQPQGIDLNQTIQQLFSAQSQGGSGYFLLNQLEINNCQVNNTKSVNGGSFYIITGSKGTMSIINSQFTQTTTQLSANTFASGGAFYIDASKSQLNFMIENTTFNRSYSLTYGGAIYIDPSKIHNQISINSVSFISCFSFQHQVISFSPNQLQSLSSFIQIKNSYFTNIQEEYELYISLIQDFSDLNVDSLKISNPLIYSQFSNITMSNCTFQQLHLANVIQIEKGIEVILEKITISNSTILFEPLISITHRENEQSKIIFQDIQIINIETFIVKNQLSCQESQLQKISELGCPNILSKNFKIPPFITNDTLQQATNINCSLLQLYSLTKNQFSLIMLKGLQNADNFNIQNVQIQNINCTNCYYGLLSLQGINKSQKQLSIKNLKILDCVCGFLGCLSGFLEFNLAMLNDQNSRVLSSKDSNFIEFDLQFQVNIKIEKSNFENNAADYGAACFFAEVNILMQDCFIKQNQATTKGGAIYFYSVDNVIQIVSSQIVENEAQVAGGIYTTQYKIQQSNNLQFILNKNIAHNYTNNILSFPSNLDMKINGIEQKKQNYLKNSSTIIDFINISPYKILGDDQKVDVLFLPSGISLSEYTYFDKLTSSYIPYNLSFRLVASNNQKEQIYDLNDAKCQIFTEIITNKQYNFNEFKYTEGTLSQTIINFNSTTGDYNMDNLIIYFNPQVNESSELQLTFKCDSIQIPQYNSEYPYELQNIISNYYLVLKLKTFECQLGEYLNKTSGGCVQCDIQQNQYSITKDSNQCEFKDEVKMRNIKSAMIDLREGYWRAFYNSRIIEECYHLELNCLGGWIAGDVSCYIGHIGALCEQCDIYNIRGLGSYSQSQNYSCSDCTKMAGNIINIIFAFLWALISIFLSVNSTIKMIDEFVIYTKLRTFGKYIIFQAASISILIKVFTNYLQIISSLSTFQLAIPIGITLTFQSVGNPIETMSFSLDCYFVQFSSLQIIYIRILWGFLQIGLFILIFLSLHIIILIINKQQLNLTFVTTTLIYIYIYLSPNLFSGLIALMSYRTISSVQWITSNVSYQFQTSEHYKWLFYFILPMFILISIILPFFFWGILYNHRAKLSLNKVRKVWGYLYNEYKQETYYWEIIKIVQKELIILVLIYYVDYVSIKSSLIFFILHLYGQLTNKYKPYQTGDLNQIDSFQTSVCKASIIIAQTIYSAQSLNLSEIIGPFYIILACLNLIFIFQIISKIFFAYFDKLYIQIDQIKQLIIMRCPIFLRKNKYCLRLLANTQERKQIIRQRFLHVKAFLLQQARQIMIYKRLNNFDLQSLKNSKDTSILYQRMAITTNKTQRLNTNLNTSRVSKLQQSLKYSDV